MVESVPWQSAHYLEPYANHRKAKFPRKLERLGLFRELRSIRVLDTCCGRGDALELMADWGFTDLTGLDATPQPNWDSLKARMVNGDVMSMPFPDESFDCITNFHALHHLGDHQGVRTFIDECRRVLRPGGRLYIIDFPASPQIRLLFKLFRLGLYPPTGGLKNFAAILDEEWGYLKGYLQDWPAVERVLKGGSLKLLRYDQAPFLYYMQLTKA